MSHYLFRIEPINAAEYAKAEAALQPLGMWLEQGTVACSDARSGQGLDREIEDQACAALAAARVMVWP